MVSSEKLDKQISELECENWDVGNVEETSIRFEGFECRSAGPTCRSTDISPPDFVEIGDVIVGIGEAVVHGHDEHEEFYDETDGETLTEAGVVAAFLPLLGFLGVIT